MQSWPILTRVTILLLICSSLSRAQSTPSVANPLVKVTSSSTTSPSAKISLAKQNKIDEMLTVTGTKSALLQNLDFGQKRLLNYAKVQSGTITPVSKDQDTRRREITTEYIAKMSGIARNQLTWDNLKLPVIQICSENLTDEELDAIIAFYKSSAGKAMVRNGPLLSKASYDALSSLELSTKALTDRATQEMQGKIEELRASSVVKQH